jgi:CHAD domain-containing protein
LALLLSRLLVRFVSSRPGITMSEPMDPSYRLLAARYIRRQAKQLGEQLDGIRKAEDIEFVHRARVASRRLRAALRMFYDCFEPKQVKRWRKQIRRVTEGLSDARDKDVQIEYLSGILCDVTDKRCSPGIARLLAQLEHQREKFQPVVLRAIGRLRAGRVFEEMQDVAKDVLAAAGEAEASVSSPFAREQTRQHILQRLQELAAYEDSLRDPEDCKRHHAMRIAAKRLRYTVEIARPVYEGQLDDTIDAVKKLQSLLGDIHDCDVWLDDLDAFAKEERARVMDHFGSEGRFIRLEPGIEYLRRERAEHRRQVFGELVHYWQQLQRQELWEHLIAVVGASCELTRTVPAAPEEKAAPAVGQEFVAHGSHPNGSSPAGSSAGEPHSRSIQGNGSRKPAEIPL